MTDRIARTLHVPAGPWSTDIMVVQTSPDYEDADVRAFREFLNGLHPGSLVFLIADATVRSTSRFLQILDSTHAVALLDANTPTKHLDRLIDTYRPDVILGEGAAQVMAHRGRELHPDLKVLLSTSGTTGSSKFVRLSTGNIEANAQQIIDTLAITDADVAVTVLPLHYSFGMSVVTSHARAGARIVVTDESIITPGFWQTMDAAQVTFFPVVPQSLGMLQRIGLADRLPESVRVMAQAGGRADPAHLNATWQLMQNRGGRFRVMYGQTEAGPRITCLPSDAFPERPGSVGLPMPGGHLRIDTIDAEVDGGRAPGEVVYTGPNVMMGYAEHRDDLATPADSDRTLRTGDIGYLDADGYLYLTGRLKRIAKVASTRLSLDEAEAIFSPDIPVPFAVVARGDDGLRVCIEAGEGSADGNGTDIDAKAIRRARARAIGITPALIEVRVLAELPLLASGKVDYAKLNELDGVL